jgi:hypothetical protein
VSRRQPIWRLPSGFITRSLIRISQQRYHFVISDLPSSGYLYLTNPTLINKLVIWGHESCSVPSLISLSDYFSSKSPSEPWSAQKFLPMPISIDRRTRPLSFLEEYGKSAVRCIRVLDLRSHSPDFLLHNESMLRY